MRISVAVQYFSSASLLGFGAVVVAAGAVFVTAGAVAAGAAVVDAGGDTAFGGLLLGGVTAGDGTIGCEYDERKGKTVTNTASKIGIPASLRLLPSNAHLRRLRGRFYLNSFLSKPAPSPMAAPMPPASRVRLVVL